jgi:hypothetical protein
VKQPGTYFDGRNSLLQLGFTGAHGSHSCKPLHGASIVDYDIVN